MNIEKLWDKYKDIIPYGVFGVLTTLVNIVSYWIFAHPFGLSVMVSTVLAWILSVLFAYLTNRKWVFHSEASTREEIGKEIKNNKNELYIGIGNIKGDGERLISIFREDY